MALLGDGTHAAGAYERLAPYARRNILNARGAAGYGSAELPLGLLASLLHRHDRAAAHLADAVEHNAAMGAEAWAQRSRSPLAALSGPEGAGAGYRSSPGSRPNAMRSSPAPR
jgi:hypothetical protein